MNAMIKVKVWPFACVLTFDYNVETRTYNKRLRPFGVSAFEPGRKFNFGREGFFGVADWFMLLRLGGYSFRWNLLSGCSVSKLTCKLPPRLDLKNLRSVSSLLLSSKLLALELFLWFIPELTLRLGILPMDVFWPMGFLRCAGLNEGVLL
jgi:hypothetical protein